VTEIDHAGRIICCDGRCRLSLFRFYTSRADRCSQHYPVVGARDREGLKSAQALPSTKPHAVDSFAPFPVARKDQGGISDRIETPP
jgi:hypothetical protein